MKQIEATALITFNPPSLRTEQTISQALELFCQWQLTELPVIHRDQQVLGILQLDAMVALANDDVAVLDRAVDQFISAHPEPFTLQRFPRIALQQMLAQGYRSLPVVEDGKLIGLIGRGDFLRELASDNSRLATSAVLDLTVSAGAGMESNATVEDAFAAMRADKADFLTIVQSGCPIAAFSHGELQTNLQLARAEELIYGQPQRPRALVQFIRQVPHLQPGQSVADAAQLMFESGTTALLVVNKAKRILGAITENIILAALLRQ